MFRGGGLALVACVIGVPVLSLFAMLLFQLKKVEVLTQDTEAELQLGRLERSRLLAEREAQEAGNPAEKAPEAADQP